MSYSRAEALLDIRDNRKPVFEHVLKCVLYPDREDKRHWMYEITNFIYDASRKSLSGNKRLKPKDYSSIFDGFGSEVSDMPDDVESFLLKTGKKYGDPDVDMNKQFYKDLFQIVQGMRKDIGVLCSKSKPSKTEILEIVENYLD